MTSSSGEPGEPGEPMRSAAAAWGPGVELGLTAVHEAAHAVAAVVLRLGLREVSIHPAPGVPWVEAGHCTLFGTPDWDASPADTPPWQTPLARAVRSWRRRDAACLVQTLAGPVAERGVVALSWSDVSSLQDAITAHELTGRITRQWLRERGILAPTGRAREGVSAPPPAELHALHLCVMRVAFAEAGRLVAAARPAINGVARALLFGPGVLSGTAVRRLVRDHGGEPSGISGDGVRVAVYGALDASVASVARPVA